MLQIGIVGYLRFGNFGDELFYILFAKLLNKYNLIIMNESPIYPWIYDFEKIKKLDMIIIIGGDLINPKYYSELYFNLEYLKYNIPIYIYNIGVAIEYNFYDKNKEAYTNFLNNNNVKSITFRDIKSYDWCIKNNLCNINKIKLFKNDIIFGLNICKQKNKIKNQSKNKKKQLGIILRKSETIINYDNFINNVKKFIENDFEINLIIAGINQIQIDDLNEYLFIINFFKNNNIKYNLLVPYDTLQIIEYICKCDYIISKKFHVCIIGLMLKKYVCSLNNENKFFNLFSTFNLEENILSIDNELLYECILKLKKPNKNQLKNIINDTYIYCKKIKKTIVNNIININYFS